MEFPPITRCDFHLEVYSHGFRVSRFNDDVRRLLVEFCQQFIKWKTNNIRGRFIREPDCVFAAATRMRDQYFFHRNVLDSFLEFFAYHGITEKFFKRTEIGMYIPAKAKMHWKDKNIVRKEHQEDIVQFCEEPNPRTKMVTLQAGQGKTYTALFYAHDVQGRMILIMRPMYMKQWQREILKVFRIAKGDMYVVQGSEALKDLIAMAQAEKGFNPQFILISNATYRNYLRTFFDHPHTDEGYGVKPWEFFALMEAECLAIDEVHQDFHLNFLIDCMSNLNKEIALSGTMVADDAFMNRMYKIKFPPDTYAPRPPLKRYIDVYSVYYRFNRPDLIRYLVQAKYHQATFEASILRQPKVLNNYTNMIVELSWHQWYKHRDYRPGSKLAIYCGRHEMCDAVLAKVKAKFSDLDCRRKIDVDPEENLLEADVIVTTLPSAGTARDIPDLGVCIATIGLSGRQASEQLIHRLREPKEGSVLHGLTPRFIFLTCRDLQKHIGYDQDRRHKLDHVVRNFNALTSTFVI
jgi:hypothetical protein